MAHKLLIVGAGFGGNGVIHGLVQAYQKESGEGSPPPKALFPGDLEITMLDRNTSFSIGGTWQFIWSSRLTSSTIQWPLVDLQANHFDNSKLITGPAEATVKEISTDQKKVTLTNGNVLDYDTLVLAPGVISDPTLVPGLPTENASIKTALDFCFFFHVPLIKEAIDQTMKEAKTQKKTILVCVTRMPYKVSHRKMQNARCSRVTSLTPPVRCPTPYSVLRSHLKWHRLLMISEGNAASKKMSKSYLVSPFLFRLLVHP
jgi:NADH dehydrogenase FAD-containing subunit